MQDFNDEIALLYLLSRRRRALIILFAWLIISIIGILAIIYLSETITSFDKTTIVISGIIVMTVIFGLSFIIMTICSALKQGVFSKPIPISIYKNAPSFLNEFMKLIGIIKEKDNLDDLLLKKGINPDDIKNLNDRDDDTNEASRIDKYDLKVKKPVNNWRFGRF
jgi:hypothetical protein